MAPQQKTGFIRDNWRAGRAAKEGRDKWKLATGHLDQPWPILCGQLSIPIVQGIWDLGERSSLPRSHCEWPPGVRTLFCWARGWVSKRHVDRPPPSATQKPAVSIPSCALSTYVSDPPNTAPERCIYHPLAESLPRSNEGSIKIDMKNKIMTMPIHWESLGSSGNDQIQCGNYSLAGILRRLKPFI